DLCDADREALLLRFFKNQDFHAVGGALGVSEDAAQKRVARCLEKLRVDLCRRGITTTAAALSTAISINAVQVAPAGLAISLTNASLVGTAAATGSTLTLLKIIAMKKSAVAGVSGLLLAGAITSVILQQRAIENLRAENSRARELLQGRADESSPLGQ